MFGQKKFIFVLFVLVMLGSLTALFQIRKLEDPVLNLPFYSINIIAPGATSNTIENDIIEQLEDKLSDMESIVEVTYTVNDNYFTVKIEAEPSVNVDDKLNELKRIVNSIDLPPYVKETVVKKINPLDVNVLQLALHYEESFFDYDLNKQADGLKNRLKTIKGVNKVFIHGERKQIVNVSLQLEKLAAIKLPIKQVLAKIKDRFSIVPSGKISSDMYSLSVKTSYGFSSINDLQNLIISNNNDNVFSLGNIATVTLEEDVNNKYYTQYNSYPCVFVTATAKKDADLFYISDEAAAIVNKFTSNNEDLIIEKVFDQSNSVAGKLNDLSINIIQGILLISILIYLILGVRNAIIIGVIIPISIISAIGLLYLLGFALQQISIAALIISLGLVIDDNIVIIENIHRLISEGKSKKTAISEGIKSIMWPVINSSVTTALVFFPMMQLGGRTGEYIKTLPITVCLCLLTSLIFSIILTPLLSEFLLKLDQKKGVLDAKLNRLTYSYSRFLTSILKRPRTISLSIVGILIVSGILFKIVGVSLFPPADKPILLIDIEMAKGGSLETTNILTQQALRLIEKEAENATLTVNIGHGNPKLYYNIFPKKYHENYAQIVVFLKEWEQDSFQNLKQKIQQKLNQLTKARITVNELMNGPPISSPIVIKILGDSHNEISTSAEAVVQLLKNDNQIHRISSPFDDQEFTYHLDLDLVKSSRLGISNTDVNRNLYMMLSGYEIDNVDFNGQEFPVKVSLNTYNGNNIYSNIANNLTVQSTTSKNYIPLLSFSKLNIKKEVNSIEFYNNKKAFTIECDVINKGVNILEKTQEIISKIERLELKNVEFEYGGNYKSSKKSFGGVLIILLIALLAIYAVLVLQFKSFHQPFIVLIAIPLAFIDAIFLLFIFSKSFSFLAFIGFTSISGIVINNSMLLVDTFNNLIKKEGYTISQAVLKSAQQRFLPILITSVTTIFGLLPMVFSGSNLWKPLALTIVGGMISSAFLVLILIPIILNNSYKLFNKNGNNI